MLGCSAVSHLPVLARMLRYSRRTSGVSVEVANQRSTQAIHFHRRTLHWHRAASGGNSLVDWRSTNLATGIAMNSAKGLAAPTEAVVAAEDAEEHLNGQFQQACVRLIRRWSGPAIGSIRRSDTER